MKQWLKKLSPNQDTKQTHVDNNEKAKKVMVSFDKHVEQHMQYVKDKNYLNTKKIEQYQQDYVARSYSNLSKCVQIDDDEINNFHKGKQQSNDGNLKRTKGDSKTIGKKSNSNSNSGNGNGSKVQLNKKQLNNNNNNSNNNKVELQSQQQSNNSSEDDDSNVKDDYNQGEQNSKEIIDSFISMTDLIKVLKNIPEAKGEYITLKYINKILIQSSSGNKTKLTNYIISKTSQGIDAYCNKFTDKQKQKASNPYNRFVKKIKKKHSEGEDERLQQINKFYFRTFSNGLTHQYYPVRSLIWKISSGYLPDAKQKWIWKMEISLLKYRQLIKQHIVETILKKKKGVYKLNQKRVNEQQQQQQQQKAIEQQHESVIVVNRKKSQTFSDPLSRMMNTTTKRQRDHPLNINQNSKWRTYFSDYQLWSLIQKDTIRTRPGSSFFRQTHLFSLTNNDTNESDLVRVQLQNGEKIQFRLSELHLSKTKKQSTTYIDAMTRIIFTYLKVNPEQKYYQGMNQLVATVYYSLTNKNNQYFRRVSQSDTYEMFAMLMAQLNAYPSHVVDANKLPVFNHFSSGQKYFELLKIMIRKYDFRLHDFLEKNKGYQYLKAISIRWFLTIFLTEFNLDETLILWDAVMVLIGNKNSSNNYKNCLKDLKLTEFILYMALAAIHLNRNQIYNEDSQEKQDCSKILIIFQKIKQKPQEIIQKALKLYKSFPNLLQ